MTRSALHQCFRLFLAALSPTAIFAQSTTGIDPAALKRLLAAAEATHSDAVVIWKDGHLVGSWHFGKPDAPIEAMSATKSIASLAVGRAVTLGAIQSIDGPVARYYPQWRQGQKAAITIRQLLDHTSGMQVGGSSEVETSPDVVQLALAAELSDVPGTRFYYNNKAVNLLAGIVQKASGRRMDELLSSDVFAHMGFGEFEWVRDTAGNPYAYARLRIRPEDLAKIGQLMLEHGRWKGQQLISPAWIDASVRGSKLNPRCGLLWWLIPDHTTFVVDTAHLRALRLAGADSTFVARMATIQGRYETEAEYNAALQKALGERYWEPYSEARTVTRMDPYRAEYGRFIGYEANGSWGQYLVVYPDQRLVAVRMMAVTETTKVTDSFDTFRVLVRALVPSPDSLELLRLESEWNRAHLHADTATLNRLWAPTLSVTVPEMAPMSKEDLLRFWRSGRSNITRYETTELTIQLLGETAIVTGRLRRERNFNGQVVADDWRFTKVYSRHSGAWRVVAYHASVRESPRSPSD